MLPLEVESARHFDLNITQRKLPLVMRHLSSQSRHCRLDEMCVRDCNATAFSVTSRPVYGTAGDVGPTYFLEICARKIYVD